jgi:hypothetical protein
MRLKSRFLRLRASIARQILRRIVIDAGDKSHIVVFSHWEFLPYLTQEEDPRCETAEWRSYMMTSDDADTLAGINI